jgi:hypothetical protein
MKINIEGFPGISTEVLSVNGVEIIRVDLNDYNGERFDELLEFMGILFRSKPLDSVRLITVMHNTTPMLTDKDIFSRYLQKNRPHIRASAYCGFPQLLLPLMKSALNFSGRDDIKFFEDETDAVIWLVST